MPIFSTAGPDDAPTPPTDGPKRRSRAGAGFTLPELLIALALTGLAAVGASAFHRYLRATALESAARVGRAALTRARMEAVHRGGRVRVRRERRQPPRLVLRDADERVVARFTLGPESGVGLDSAELRRSTLSFNERGQAAPGSLYLYQGRRGVRLVVNFVGRVRREDFAVAAR